VITINILTALLAAVIAIITTYIAFQQLALARQKRDLELYDRRSRIFKATMEFIRRVLRDWEVTEDILDQFVRDTAETSFFFEKDVEDQIETLYVKGLDLLYAAKEKPASRGSSGTEAAHAPIRFQQDILVDWFAKQPKQTKDLFKPYLTKGVK